MIRAENLTKTYNGVKAVDSVNIRVEAGHVCGFVGSNGAGKTTTIGMMTGLIEPTGGRCFIKDLEVTRHPLEVKKIISYLPDGFGFYTNLSAEQNLKFFARLYELKDAQANQKIAELLKYVGLAQVTKKVGTYSKGMRQRLGLARVLLNDPDVLFFDEPTNGLDPEGVVQFRNVIREQAEKGKTIFFSSHNLAEVEHTCDMLCIISKGRIVTQGKLEEIKAQVRKDLCYRIIVRVDGKLPELSHPAIIDTIFDGGYGIIKASSDIRDYVFDQVVSHSLRMREFRLEEEPLEDLFLETVYRSG